MIRPATITDVPTIRTLFAAYLAEGRTRFPDVVPYPAMGEHGLDQFTLCLVDILRAGPDWLVLVAEDAEEIVGFMVTESCRHLIGEPDQFIGIHWLYVRPHARERGADREQSLARAMVRTTFMWAVERGIDAIECEARLGDDQWQRRTLTPFKTTYHGRISEVVAWMVNQEATSNGNGKIVESAPIAVTAASRVKTARRKRKPVRSAVSEA